MDGISQVGGGNDSGKIISRNTPLTIGQAGSGAEHSSHLQYFVGSIDDIRIYNRALSQNEVKQLYQNPIVPESCEPSANDDGSAPITLSSDMKFRIPYFIYESATGALPLWADFEYLPIEGKIAFEVTDYGPAEEQPQPNGDADGDGYTVAAGDCNDNDKNIHPSANEVVGDKVAQDCVPDLFD